MQEFIKKQGGDNRRASKAEKHEAWVSASSKNITGGSPMKGFTEDDLKSPVFTKAELRKNKEQYLTDIMCAIPEVLEIDMDC